jgi:hypothetical protein
MALEKLERTWALTLTSTKLPDGDCAGQGGIAAGRDVGVVEDRCERPTGLLRRCGQAAEETRYPETYSVFVSARRDRRVTKRKYSKK